MAFLDTPINAADLPKDEGGFEALPEGEYHVKIDDCELCNTKAGDGQYFKFKLKVTGDKYTGRVLFANVTRRNPNEKAEQIGQGQLRTIMTACGLATLQDTDQLIGGELIVRVAQREYQGAMQNEVKGYKIASDAVPPVITEPATKKSAPPWAKK